MLNKAFERYPKADGIIMHSDWIKKQAEIIWVEYEYVKKGREGLFFLFILTSGV
jgi:hypothetical protein